MPDRTALSTRHDFELWIFKMDDDLAEFFEQLPEDVRRGLDFSPASLDVLEKWLLPRYPSHEAMFATSDKYLACYAGELAYRFGRQAWGTAPHHRAHGYQRCQLAPAAGLEPRCRG